MSIPNHRHATRLPDYDYSQAGAYFITIVTQKRLGVFGQIVQGEMHLNDAGKIIEMWWCELSSKFSHVQTDEYIIMPNHFHGIVFIVGAEECAHIGAPLRTIDNDHVGADLRVGPGSHTDVSEEGAHTGAPLPTIDNDHVGADLRVGPGSQTDSSEEGAHIGAPLPEPGSHTGSSEEGAHAGAPLPGPGSYTGSSEEGAHTGAPLRTSGSHAGVSEEGAHTGAPLPTHGGVPLPQIMQWFKTMTTNAYIHGVKQNHWLPFPGKLWQRSYYEHVIRNPADLNRVRTYIIDNPRRWSEDPENVV